MNLIVAVDKNWAIGYQNKLLVSIPEDMKFFRTTTTGKVVVMGRKTLDSFPGGKPLPGRRNIVITRNVDFDRRGCEIAATLKAALELAGDTNSDDLWVIGGGSVYTALLSRCKRVYLTKVDAVAEDADTFFPNLDKLPVWEVEHASEPVTENGVTYRFIDYINTKL